jgi:hypothetical protein
MKIIATLLTAVVLCFMLSYAIVDFVYIEWYVSSYRLAIVVLTFILSIITTVAITTSSKGNN